MGRSHDSGRAGSRQSAQGLQAQGISPPAAEKREPGSAEAEVTPGIAELDARLQRAGRLGHNIVQLMSAQQFRAKHQVAPAPRIEQVTMAQNPADPYQGPPTKAPGFLPVVPTRIVEKETEAGEDRSAVELAQHYSQAFQVSPQEQAQRLKLHIGVNQKFTLAQDPGALVQHAVAARQAVASSPFSVAVNAFFWGANWSKGFGQARADYLTLDSEEEKAAVREEEAKALTEVGFPFGNMRVAILDSADTKSMAGQLNPRVGSLYVHFGDADIVTFKDQSGQGLFDRFDTAEQRRQKRAASSVKIPGLLEGRIKLQEEHSKILKASRDLGPQIADNRKLYKQKSEQLKEVDPSSPAFTEANQELEALAKDFEKLKKSRSDFDAGEQRLAAELAGIDEQLHAEGHFRPDRVSGGFLYLERSQGGDLPDDELVSRLTVIANQLDMGVRQTMAEVHPDIPYYSEANTFLDYNFMIDKLGGAQALKSELDIGDKLGKLTALYGGKSAYDPSLSIVTSSRHAKVTPKEETPASAFKAVLEQHMQHGHPRKTLYRIRSQFDVSYFDLAVLYNKMLQTRLEDWAYKVIQPIAENEIAIGEHSQSKDKRTVQTQQMNMKMHHETIVNLLAKIIG